MIIIALFMSASLYTHAITVPKDVPVTSPPYPAIQSSLDAGYLSLDKSGKFYPDRAISRADMATVISRLDSKLMRQYFSMTQADFETLLQFNQSFKPFVVNTESDISRLSNQMTALETAIADLNTRTTITLDESQVRSETQLETLKQAGDTNRKLLIVSIILSVIALVSN